MLLRVAHKQWPWLVGATLLVIVLSALTLVLFRQTDEAENWRSHTYVVLNQAERMLSAVKDAETGERGYLLTGDETFLEPYRAVQDTIGGQVAQLRQLTREIRFSSNALRIWAA